MAPRSVRARRGLAVLAALAASVALFATVNGGPPSPPDSPRTSDTPSSPLNPENSRQDVLHTLRVLVRAGEPAEPLREVTRRLLNVKDPWYFGVQQFDRISDLFLAYRAVEVFDAVLGRDRWLTPEIRNRLLISAREDVAQAIRRTDHPSRIPAFVTALRLFRALGADDQIGITVGDVRAGCETGAAQPLSRLSGASDLLGLLGEPGCHWTPTVLKLVRETRASLDRAEVDYSMASNAEKLVSAAVSVADRIPEAEAMVAELRGWVREVLADRSTSRLPDLVDPMIIDILVEALPRGEPVVLSPRLHDHLRFVLTVPWERDRRGVETVEPPG